MPEIRSKYPAFKDSGPKNHTLNGFWDQSLNNGYVDPLGSIWTMNPDKGHLVLKGPDGPGLET